MSSQRRSSSASRRKKKEAIALSPPLSPLPPATSPPESKDIVMKNEEQSRRKASSRSRRSRSGSRSSSARRKKKQEGSVDNVAVKVKALEASRKKFSSPAAFALEGLGAKAASRTEIQTTPLIAIVTSTQFETFAILKTMALSASLQVVSGMDGHEKWNFFVGEVGGIAAICVTADDGVSGARSGRQTCIAIRNSWNDIRAIIAFGVGWAAPGRGVGSGAILVSSSIQVYDPLSTGKDGKIKLEQLSIVPQGLIDALTDARLSFEGEQQRVLSGLMVSSDEGFSDESEIFNAITAVNKARKQPIIGGAANTSSLVSAAGAVPVAIFMTIAKKGRDEVEAVVNAASFLEATLRRSLDKVKALPLPQGARISRIDDSLFVKDKSRGFVGREGLFKRLSDWLPAGKDQTVLLTGQAGAGKSAFAAALLGRGKVVASHFCHFDDRSSLDGDVLVQNLAGQLIDWAHKAGLHPSDECVTAVEEQGSQANDKAWARFLTVFKSSVKYTGDPLMVVVDGVDAALELEGGEDGNRLLGKLCAGRKVLPPWLKLVLTSRDDPLTLARVRSRLPSLFRLDISGEDNSKDIRQFVAAQLGPGVGRADVDTVVEATGGNFLFAVRFLQDKCLGDPVKLLQDGRVPEGLSQLFSAQRSRLFPSTDDLTPMIAVLMVAKAPLPYELLYAALKHAQVTKKMAEEQISHLGPLLRVTKHAVRLGERAELHWMMESTGGAVKAREQGHDLLAQACVARWPAEQGSYVDSFACAHVVAGTGVCLDAFVKAVGGVDVEAGAWYQHGYAGMFSSRHTLIRTACAYGKDVIVRRLVTEFKSKAKDLVDKRRGRTPLHAASRNGHTAVVRLLVKELGSTVVDHADWAFQTPLFSACVGSHADVVKVLLNEGQSSAVDIPAEHVVTPLHMASTVGAADVARVLLVEGKSAAIDKVDSGGSSCVRMACSRDHPAVLRVLLEVGKPKFVHKANSQGDTPLYSAAQRGSIECAKILLGTAGVKVDAPSRLRWTPLMSASSNGHAELVRLLLTEGKSKAVDQTNSAGWTPLNAASHNGHTSIVQLLLKEGKSQAIDRANNNGWTPLHSAAGRGFSDIVRLLLLEGKSTAVDTANNNGWTPLNTASSNGHVETLRVLLDEGKSQALETINSNGWTPLCGASSNGHADVVRLLIAAGASVDTPNRNSWTPLNLASTQGHAATVAVILQEGRSKAFDVLNNNGWSPLCGASSNGHADVVRLLIAEGGSAVGVDATNPSQWTPLHLASLHGFIDCVRVLLNEGQSRAVDLPNKTGETPLLSASAKGHLDIVRLLLKEGKSQALDMPSDNGDTPLYRAAGQGRLEVVRFLLSQNPKTTVDTPRKDGWTPLHIAASMNHVSTLREMLSAGDYKAVNVGKHKSVNPLHASTNEGVTPLYAAVHNGSVEAAKALLSMGADVNYPAGDPVLGAAYLSEKHQTELLTLLRQAGAREPVSCLKRVGSQEYSYDHNGPVPISGSVKFPTRDFVSVKTRFRMTVIEPGENSSLAVGFCVDEMPMAGVFPGWGKLDFGFHGDDGGLYSGTGQKEKVEGPNPWKSGDVVEAWWDRSERAIGFVYNGTAVKHVFRGLDPFLRLHAVATSHSKGSRFKIDLL